MTTIATPNETLYVSNIDWKIKKPLLRRALYALFTRHGKVLEVIALRKDGLRGQAFVMFDNVQSATAALQAEQGFTFFGKDLKLAYAKETSDRIAKRNGTYLPKAKRRKIEASSETTGAPAINEQDGAETATAAVVTTQSEGASVTVPSPPNNNSSKDPSAAIATTTPTRILFAKDLPSECNEMMLAMLFRQYTGFQEVRLPRPGLAFIEFDDEPHATLALDRLNGFQLTTTESLKLTYGKA